MAKKVVGLDVSTGKTRAGKVARHKEVDWPVTRVDTRGKRIARSLWG